MDTELDRTLISLVERIAARADVPLPQREEAFRRLYELSSSKLYGVALRVTGNREKNPTPDLPLSLVYRIRSPNFAYPHHRSVS